MLKYKGKHYLDCFYLRQTTWLEVTDYGLLTIVQSTIQTSLLYLGVNKRMHPFHRRCIIAHWTSFENNAKLVPWIRIEGLTRSSGLGARVGIKRSHFIK